VRPPSRTLHRRPSHLTTASVMLAPAAPQPGDQRQDFVEHLTRHRDLGHLERDIPPVADNLRTDLDQLFPQAGQRPRFRRFGHRQRAHEVTEIVGQCVELEAHRVGGEGPARQPRPLDRTRPLLDPLLRYNSPGCHSTLTTTRLGFLQLCA
jgi:hypothetical protein